MKILGVMSILFGMGLIVIFVYGLSIELGKGRPDSTGVMIAFGLLLAGLAIIWFAGRTIGKKEIRKVSHEFDSILDMPEHLLTDKKARALPVFTTVCGYISLFASVILLLFMLYAFYPLLRRGIVYGHWRDETFYLLGLLLGSVVTIVYSLRKLFFSGS